MNKKDDYLSCNPLKEATPNDIYNCFAVGFHIVNDYLEYVIATGEYKVGELTNTSPELVRKNLLDAYCKFISRLIDLKQLNMQIPTIDTLQNFLEAIPNFEHKFAKPKLMPYLLDEPQIVKKLSEEFNSFSKDIHRIIPTYKGIPYEQAHIAAFSKNVMILDTYNIENPENISVSNIRNNICSTDNEDLCNYIEDEDLYCCIATGFRIISDYIENVVQTGLYESHSECHTLPKELVHARCLGILCQYITDIQHIKYSQLAPLKIENLSDFLQSIPCFNQHLVNPHISGYALYESGKVQKALDKLSNDIHSLMPSYKGIPYEHGHYFQLFKAWENF